jgi:hypothetical protein
MPRGVPSQYNASLSLEIFNHHLSKAKEQVLKISLCAAITINEEFDCDHTMSI